MNLYRTMKNLKLAAATIIVLVAFFSAASAQKVKTMTFESDGPGGEIFMLNELGGLFMEVDEMVKVEMVMLPDQRPKEYKDVDLEAGDIIKMANGKKINSVKDFSGLYEELKIGETLKLGILRGKRMKMVSLVKGDPETMPTQMMMMTTDKDADGGNVDILTGLVSAGMLLSLKNDKLFVEDMIEQIVIPFGGPSPANGDIIIAINGELPNGPDKLDQFLASIQAGEKVKLDLLRDGKEISTSFIKPDDSEQPMIQRKVIKQGE